MPFLDGTSYRSEKAASLHASLTVTHQSVECSLNPSLKT